MSSPNDRTDDNCHFLNTSNVLGPRRVLHFLPFVCENTENRPHPPLIRLPQMPEPGSTRRGPSVPCVLPAALHRITTLNLFSLPGTPGLGDRGAGTNYRQLRYFKRGPRSNQFQVVMALFPFCV